MTQARTLGTMLALWLPLLPLYIVMRKVLEGRLGNRCGGWDLALHIRMHACMTARHHLCRRKQEDARSRAPPVTFGDVAGVDSAKEELLEVVACLKDSQRCEEL